MDHAVELTLYLKPKFRLLPICNNGEYILKVRLFWDMAPCSHIEVDQRFRGVYCLASSGQLIITLMIEAVHTSETSVNFNVTRQRYIPEDSKLHTRHREYLTFRREFIFFDLHMFYMSLHICSHCFCSAVVLSSSFVWYS
jgi:hypothetical protein